MFKILFVLTGFFSSCLVLAADADLTVTTRTDFFLRNGEENLRVRSFSIDGWFAPGDAKKFKVVFRGDIDHALNSLSDGKTKNPDWDSEKFLERAYFVLDIDEITGKAIVVSKIAAGKMELPWGARTTKGMLTYQHHPVDSDSKIEEVFGVALTLTPQIAQMLKLDKIELAVFETGSGDLKFFDGKGFSIRMTKAFTERLKVKGSIAYLEHDKTKDAEESEEVRTSLALIYSLSSNEEVRFEWLHYGADGSRRHPKTDNAVIIGYTYFDIFQVEGLNFVLEGTYLDGPRDEDDEESWQIGGGINYELYDNSDREWGLQNSVVGLEGRMGDGGEFIGVRWNNKFGVPKRRKKSCPDNPKVGDFVPAGCKR